MSNSIPMSKYTPATHKYRWIDMNTYDKCIWFQKQCKVCYVIQGQCNVAHHLSHICINTNFTLLASSSSPSITQMDTSDITVKSIKTGDTTSGKQNILKNFAKNICMAKYPYWHMKKNW